MAHVENVCRDDSISSVEMNVNVFLFVAISVKIDATIVPPVLRRVQTDAHIANVGVDVESLVYLALSLVTGDASITHALGAAARLATGKGVMNHVESACPAITCA